MAGHGPDMSKEIVQGIFGALAMIVVCAAIGSVIASALSHGPEHVDPQRIENPRATTGAAVPATAEQITDGEPDPKPKTGYGDGAADQEPGVGAPPPDAPPTPINPPGNPPAPEVQEAEGEPT